MKARSYPVFLPVSWHALGGLLTGPDETSQLLLDDGLGLPHLPLVLGLPGAGS